MSEYSKEMQAIADKGYSDVMSIRDDSSNYIEHLQAIYTAALEEVEKWVKDGIFQETADCKTNIFLSPFDIPNVTIWVKKIVNWEKYQRKSSCYKKSYFIHGYLKNFVIDFKRY